MHKLFITTIFFIATSVWAQDVASLLRGHEDKSYSPKYKGATDIVVEIEIPTLTKQLNEQMIFGNIRELYFRVYWTAAPERIAVEVLGMPEGFNEIKQQLKQMALAKFETIIPVTLEKKFAGYKFSLNNKKNKSIIAKDEKALNLIPEFILNFGKDGVIDEIIGKKPVGSQTNEFSWEVKSWSEPRLVNMKSTLKASDGPQSTVVESVIEWTQVNSIGVPESVKTITKQVVSLPDSATQEATSKEEVKFKNYKINIGEALKWFLANSSN